jgi:hypothetical protein
MYAETKAEKRKYARKFSKLFYQYTDRVLGFQKLIRQANKDFYGNPSMLFFFFLMRMIKRDKSFVNYIAVNF